MESTSKNSAPFFWDGGRTTLLTGLYFLHPDYDDNTKQQEIFGELTTLVGDLSGERCSPNDVQTKISKLKMHYVLQKIQAYVTHLGLMRQGKSNNARNNSVHTMVKLIDDLKERNAIWNYKYWSHPETRNRLHAVYMICKTLKFLRDNPFSFRTKPRESDTIRFCKFLADILIFIKEVKGEAFAKNMNAQLFKALYTLHRCDENSHGRQKAPVRRGNRGSSQEPNANGADPVPNANNDNPEAELSPDDLLELPEIHPKCVNFFKSRLRSFMDYDDITPP